MSENPKVIRAPTLHTSEKLLWPYSHPQLWLLDIPFQDTKQLSHPGVGHKLYIVVLADPVENGVFIWKDLMN